MDGLNVKLAAYEQIYRETAELLDHEEGRLKEKRKQAGGNSIKLRKVVQDTFELNALKQFNNLRIEYQRKKAENSSLKLGPSLKAGSGRSTTVPGGFERSQRTSTGLVNCKPIKASCWNHVSLPQFRLGLGESFR